MSQQTTSSQVPFTDKATATNVAPKHTSNAGRKRRSCFMCSKRKVKCDKQKPCICCVKAGIECVFPNNATNRNEAGMSPELVEMIQRLEKAVQTLGPKESDSSTIVPSTGHHAFSHDGGPQTELRPPSAPSPTTKSVVAKTAAGLNDQGVAIGSEKRSQGIEPRRKAPSVASSHGESPGKIVRDHGRDTYVRRWFWDDGNTEMDTCSPSDTDSEHGHQDHGACQHSSTGQTTGITGSSREKVTQILADQKMNLWSIYKERVEPLTKLLHLPSLEQAVVGSNRLDAADGMQCVLLAIYYGAVTSLGEEECVIIFGDGQSQVLSRMREQLEELFAKTSLLHTGDIRPLQALTLYLVFLRHHEPRKSWKLSGLAIRLAQNFGLHREDSFSGLTEFETEMRRRLWWQLATMDAPSAEDYSGEYNLLEMSSFDTHPPQNLNDAQLDPAMTQYPPKAAGITEMTFTLASCQITNMYRCIADSRRECGNTGKGYADLTPQERADWIRDCESNFSERFLRDCSPTNSFHWVTVILTKMLFHKVRLHGCNPLQDVEAMPEETCERLFLVAVEVIELNYKLRTDPRTRPWLWLFSSYTQWHAFSLVLVWLRMKPLRKNSRRAWEAVEKAIVLRWEHPVSLLNGRKPQQWRSIIRLLEKARAARRKASSNRARRGSRNPNFTDQTFVGELSGSVSTAASAVTSQRSWPSETDASKVSSCQSLMRSQPHAQEQPNARPPKLSAIGPPTSSGGTSDNSTSATRVNETNQNPWALTSESTLADCSIDSMADAVSDPDFMMMDGQFSVDDFEGLQDLAFLDDLIY